MYKESADYLQLLIPHSNIHSKQPNTFSIHFLFKMVQIISKFLILGAIVLGVSAISLPKRTIAQVEKDIASIHTQVTSLDSSINAFPDSGGSINAALVRLSFSCLELDSDIQLDDQHCLSQLGHRDKHCHH